MPPKKLEGIIESERYTLYDEVLGRGAWGAVYLGKDNITGEEVAIKVHDPTDIAKAQMAQRELTELKAMKKDAGKREACANIVRRDYEEDRNGKPFIVMPRYRKFLSDILHDSNHLWARAYVKNPNEHHALKLDEAVGYLSDIANGISEMHTKLERVYADLKPDNIAVDERREAKIRGVERRATALINDLGTSTVIESPHESPRTSMGFEFTRAPECWTGKDHTPQSDVWAFGSLMYRMLTGQYVFEEEIKNSKDPAKYFDQLDEKVAKTIINRKIRNAPKHFRRFLARCLAYDPNDRYKNGEVMKKEIDIVIAELNLSRRVTNRLRLASPFVLASLVIGILAYKGATMKPTEITLPEIESHGIVFSEADSAWIKGTDIRFEREKGIELPEVETPEYKGELPELIRAATKNKYVAKLMLAYERAAEDFGWHPHGKGYNTQAQYDMWLAVVPSSHRSGPLYPGLAYQEVAASISLAMTKSRTPEGKVDLEDVCTIARVGLDVLDRARRSAGSFRFEDYIGAKDRSSRWLRDQPIIPEQEQRFIRRWLAYIE